MVKIKQINNIHAQITEGLEHVQKILEYEKEYWQQGKFCKERMTYQAKTYTKSGKILAGLIPYIQNYCRDKEIVCEVDEHEQVLPTFEDQELHGVTLRPEQLRLVNTAIEKHRGVLKGFTGVGKSYILSAIMNHYPTGKFLVLVHTIDLVNQLYETFLEFGMDVGRFTGKYQEEDHNIIVGTAKTCVKYDWKNIDGVFVDECHHISGEKTQYSKLLSKIDVSIRIGFSATPKTKKDAEGFFASTGALGPVIDEVDFQEGKERGQLIPVKLKFIRVPINHEIRKITNYNTFMDIGVVNNNRRNKQIIKQAHELSQQDKSSLILITKTDHGRKLQEMAEIYDWKIPFVFGDTSIEKRSEVKKELENKQIKCVISSIIWTEGISISTLDSIFLAAVGKKESKTLQCIGRGLRNADNKNEILVYDFLDLSSKYSVKQLGERLLTYSEFGWL